MISDEENKQESRRLAVTLESEIDRAQDNARLFEPIDPRHSRWTKIARKMRDAHDIATQMTK